MYEISDLSYAKINDKSERKKHDAKGKRFY